MSEWPTTRLDCAGREQHFYTSCVRRPGGLTPSVLLVRTDAPVINPQLTQGCLHESAQVFGYLQWRMIAVRCLLSDALQISTGLARIRNLSARSEGGRFRAASSRDPADIPNLCKQAPQRLYIDRSGRKLLRSRWLGTRAKAGATNFCCGAAVIVYDNSIAAGVSRTRLGYGSQNTFNALLRFLFRRRGGLVVRWRDCLLSGYRVGQEQLREREK